MDKTTTTTYVVIIFDFQGKVYVFVLNIQYFEGAIQMFFFHNASNIIDVPVLAFIHPREWAGDMDFQFTQINWPENDKARKTMGKACSLGGYRFIIVISV